MFIIYGIYCYLKMVSFLLPKHWQQNFCWSDPIHFFWGPYRSDPVFLESPPIRSNFFGGSTDPILFKKNSNVPTPAREKQIGSLLELWKNINQTILSLFFQKLSKKSYFSISSHFRMKMISLHVKLNSPSNRRRRSSIVSKQ
jgi:hypothetical protein